MLPGGSGFYDGTQRSPNRWKAANIAVIKLKLGASGRIGASVSITRPNLPILPQPTLHLSTPQKDDAVAEAKRSTDRILWRLDA
jgi:hypothetical protein